MQAHSLPEGHGELLWSPSPQQADASRLHHYQQWLARERGVERAGYEELWRWSIDELDDFWQSIWDYFGVTGEGEREPALGSREMPGAQWFPNMRLNYAENLLRNATDQRPAIVARTENGSLREVSWAELEQDTAALAACPRRWGVRPGDRVGGYLP